MYVCVFISEFDAIIASLMQRITSAVVVVLYKPQQRLWYEKLRQRLARQVFSTVDRRYDEEIRMNTSLGISRVLDNGADVNVLFVVTCAYA